MQTLLLKPDAKVSVPYFILLGVAGFGVKVLFSFSKIILDGRYLVLRFFASLVLTKIRK